MPEEQDHAVDDETFGSDLPEALRQEWSKEGGTRKNIEAVNRRVVLALGNLDEAEHDDLLSSFDAELDDASRIEIARHHVDHGGQWPAASETQVREFAQTEWGKGCSMLGDSGARGT